MEIELNYKINLDDLERSNKSLEIQEELSNRPSTPTGTLIHHAMMNVAEKFQNKKIPFAELLLAFKRLNRNSETIQNGETLSGAEMRYIEDLINQG